MLELIQFVFSGFWIWLGTVILLGVLSTAVQDWIRILTRGIWGR